MSRRLESVSARRDKRSAAVTRIRLPPRLVPMAAAFSNVNLPITHAFLLGILEAFTAATFSRFLIEAPFLRLK